jgi:hypothetical protein
MYWLECGRTMETALSNADSGGLLSTTTTSRHTSRNVGSGSSSAHERYMTSETSSTSAIMRIM